MKIVCIPAYNEEIKINDVVKKSLPYADKVIVCDDGSTDDTAALAKKAGAVVISHEKNQGALALPANGSLRSRHPFHFGNKKYYLKYFVCHFARA